MTARSAVSNGSKLLIADKEIDYRSAFARRMFDLSASYTSDLGGSENISEAQRALINLVVHTQLQTELMASKFAANENNEASKTMFDLYIRACGSLNRLLKTLGLKRRARDITPTLDEYVRGRRMEAAE